MSSREIAKIYNCNSSTVLRGLQKVGIKMKSTGGYRKYSFNECYFDKIDTGNKAYFLGLLATDGCVKLNDNKVVLACHRKDKELLDMFCCELDRECSYYENKRGILYLELHSEHFKNRLISLGIIPQKTFVIRFPFQIPEKFYRDFIRGAFDGDGCIFADNTCSPLPQLRFSIVSASREFLEDIQTILVNQLGITKTLISYSNSAKTWCLRHSGNKKCKMIYDYLYQGTTTYLKRKKDIFEMVFTQKGGELSLARGI